jgi:hypothetical protein
MIHKASNLLIEKVSKFIDRTNDFAPNLKVHICRYLKRLVVLVFRHEKHFAVLADKKLFDAHFVADTGNDNIARHGFDHPVNYQNRFGKDADIDHRIAFRPDKKSRKRMLNKFLIKVNDRFDVIIGRRGKTARNAIQGKRDQNGIRLFNQMSATADKTFRILHNLIKGENFKQVLDKTRVSYMRQGITLEIALARFLVSWLNISVEF